MLVLAGKPEELIDAVIDDAGLRQMARNIWNPPWKERLKQDRKLRRKIKNYLKADTRVFTNEGSARRVVVVQTGADFFIYARRDSAYLQAMKDIYAPNVEPGIRFPDRGMRRYWDKWNKGQPYIFVHGPFGAWKRGVEAGFKKEAAQDTARRRAHVVRDGQAQVRKARQARMPCHRGQ